MSTLQEKLPLSRFIHWVEGNDEFIRMNHREPHVEAAIERVKAGAVDDYSDVVKAYHLRLRNFIVGSCPPGVDPDEIAHRAFIEAFRQIQSYRLGTNFYGWLSVIARNLLLAELKRYQRLQKKSASYLEYALAQGLAEAVEAESTESRVDEDRVAALRSCQEQLSPEARFLLQARYDNQTPLEQVAQHMGKSVAAVKFQLFAIRKKLLKCVRGKLIVRRLAEERGESHESN